MPPPFVDNNSEYLHLALLQANIGIWDCNVQTGEIQFDSYWAEQFGHTDANTLPTLSYWESLIHPEDQPKTREKLTANLEGKTELFESEHRLQNSEGTWRWFHARGRVVSRDASGVPLRHVGAFWDITEHKETRKALEDDLRKSEERYRLMVEKVLDESEECLRLISETAPVGISQYNAASVLIECNDRFSEMMGAPKDRLIGLNAIESTRNDGFRAVIKKALKGEMAVFEGEYTSATGGKTIQGRASFSPIFSKGHEVSGCIGIIEDISERIKALQSLRESEEKYRGLAERIPGILMLTDLKGRPHYVSPSVSGILGYAVDDMMGKQPHDFLSAEDTARILGMMSMLEQGMDMESVEVTVPRKNGTPAIIEWAAIPVYRDEKITGFQFLGRDHTDRRAAEEELKKSKEKLRNLSAYLQTSREQERKRIAREIHDALGQTLTAIKLEAAWLKKQIPELRKDLIDKTAAVVSLVDASIQTVKRICTDLRPGLLDDLGLFAAIEWMAKDFQKRTGIHICVAEPHQDIEMNDDLATSIFRIFQEALTNVARHSQATDVTISLRQRPKMIELVVNDNGIGITQAEIDDRGSFGLMGMTERVHGLGGGIKIFGDKGKGTTITVRIPDNAGHSGFLD